MKTSTYAMLLWYPLSVMGIPCGKWYSKDCLSETDIRYDTSVSYNLEDQAIIWSRIEGYYIGTADYFKGGKEIVTEPAFYDPDAPFFEKPHLPPFKEYLNVTIDGSRAIFEELMTAMPADPLFCEQPEPDGKANHIGNLVCGVDGLASLSVTNFVSTYAKDGSAISLPDHQTGFVSKVTAVDDHTWYGSVRTDNLFVSITSKCVDGDQCDHYATDMDYFVIMGGETLLLFSKKVRFDRLYSEQDFRDAVKEGLDASMVPERVQEVVDLDAACLNEKATGRPCLDEDDWCEYDPVCRDDNPFVEPDSSLTPGVIVGLVLLGIAIVAAVFYKIHRHRLAAQQERYKDHFASRIAESIIVDGDASMMDMTPEMLAAEFEKIDISKDGKVQRTELWAFLQTGKAGRISENDFHMLFDAIDASGDNEVDFLEFCSFLGKCTEHMKSSAVLHQANGKKGKMDRKSLAQQSAAFVLARVKDDISQSSANGAERVRTREMMQPLTEGEEGNGGSPMNV